MSVDFDVCTREQAIRASGAFKKTRSAFQTVIVWTVGQVLSGNASAVSDVFQAAGLIYAPQSGGHALSKDGKIIFAYMRDACQLGKVLRFAEKNGTFRMSKDWVGAAEKIDRAAVWEMLQTVPWTQYAKPKTAHDPKTLEQEADAFAKRWTKRQESPEVIAAALAAKLGIKIGIQGSKPAPKAKAKTEPKGETAAPETKAA